MKFFSLAAMALVATLSQEANAVKIDSEMSNERLYNMQQTDLEGTTETEGVDKVKKLVAYFKPWFE